VRTPLVVAAILLATLGTGCAATPGSSPSAPSSPTHIPSPSPSPSQSSPATEFPTPTSSKRPTDPGTPPVAKGVGPAGSIVTTGSEAVALTFDDGPWPEYTPLLLDLLKAYNVKATFCVIGKQALAYPELIRRIYDEGHTFCNHSWRHDIDLRLRGDSAIRDDLNATIRAIHDAAPLAQISYFRAPGGNFDDGLVNICRSMGMTPLYWYVDTRDWEYTKYTYGTAMVDNIVTRVERDSRRGSIILSHDKGKPDTVTAYQTLLPWLKQHYQLIALPADGKLPRP
jgi:peptidoglycan/xylan/chitin deacetylase (PgdA/CDA1 family)